GCDPATAAFRIIPAGNRSARGRRSGGKGRSRAKERLVRGVLSLRSEPVLRTRLPDDGGAQRCSLAWEEKALRAVALRRGRSWSLGGVAVAAVVVAVVVTVVAAAVVVVVFAVV